MTVVFVESEDFTEVLATYFVGDDDYQDFQKYLMANPEAGNVIPGCSGIIFWSRLEKGLEPSTPAASWSASASWRAK